MLQQRADQSAQLLIHSIRLHRAGCALPIQPAEIGEREGCISDGQLRSRIELDAAKAHRLPHVMQPSMPQTGPDNQKVSAGQCNRAAVREFIRSRSIQQEEQLVMLVRVPGNSR